MHVAVKVTVWPDVAGFGDAVSVQSGGGGAVTTCSVILTCGPHCWVLDWQGVSV